MGASIDEPNVKIRFRLVADSEGWPPVESEGVWAEPLGDDEYRVQNTPWFIRSLANGDVVKALAGSDGVLWAVDRLRASGYMTIRVIPFINGPLKGSISEVLTLFSPLGVTGEGATQYGLVALEVPPGCDLRAVKTLLLEGAQNGSWDFEEGAVTDTWTQL